MKTYGQNRPDGQARVLTFIREFYRKNVLPATIRQIQEGCGFKSPRAVSYHIEVLLRQKQVQFVGELKSKRCIPAKCTRNNYGMDKEYFIVRCLNWEASKFSDDNAIYAAVQNMQKRYGELRLEMSFEDAHNQTKAEWLQKYLRDSAAS